MTETTLKYLEVGDSDADKCVIWLHGLGADGYDFKPIVPELNLPENNRIRFVFPHAPQRPVTINAGVVMPAWYDLTSMDFTNHEDADGINTSSKQIIELLEQQQSTGIDSKQIVLAGFSQGGAIALHTALRYDKPLAGIMALSTYLPLVQTFPAELSKTNRSIPILMCHGSHDPVVPHHLGEDTKYFLEQENYKVDWHSYPMQHSVCPEEINDISQWLKKILL